MPPIRSPDDAFRAAIVYRAAGVLGLAGSAAAILGNVIGVIVHDQVGFVADTISDLAAGRHAWIQDVGIYACALGLLAVAAALYDWQVGGWRWKLGAVLLGAVAATIFVIGAHGEYGDRDEGGLVIHPYVVSLFGIQFAAAALLLADGLETLEAGWSRFSRILAGIWLVAGPLFFVVPTSWDGLYERAVAGLMLLWLVAVSRLLLRKANGQPGPHHR